jgi:gamma-glutamyltranspeptidase
MVKVSNVLDKTSEVFISISGITALLGLGILENIQEQGLSKPLLEMRHNSAEYLHTLIEALRCVFYMHQKLDVVVC